MSDIDVDVKNLFKKIGGVEPAYQELKRQSRVDQARSRWPLLHSLQGEAAELVFPPRPKPENVTEIRPSRKSGISKLFKSLGAEKTPEAPAAPAPREAPLSGLFATGHESKPEFFGKARSPSLFTRLFESPKEIPADSWQSLFDRLEKS